MTETINETKHQFNAEVGKILQLMIHSLYTNKDIFLRELISNSSDAIDKLRYLSITNPDLSKDDHNYKITIETNEQDGTITITDNGIGMSKDELINNLGTIAKSGTQAFLEQITGDAKKDTQLIGQFGVGFYSSFMVAESVTVKSRRAGSDEAWEWKSLGDGEFTIKEDNYDKRGTKIILKLRENSKEYLDRHRVSYVVKTYSDHISAPITFIDSEGKEENLNSSSALWTKSKSEISDEEYKNFYKAVSHQFDDPWMVLHNRNEGLVEFTNLLFIPSRKPFDLFHPDRMARVKLYIKKVFITEQVELIPAYLRFLRGVVDSQDLPLNISRETLQHNAVLEKIKRAIIKRVLSELKKKAENNLEEYKAFWENFGAVLKEGLCEGGEFRDDILEVCRFNSTHDNEQTVSLADYISRMKEGQNTIYYLTGDSLESLRKSPQLEGFVSRGIEVLLFNDHVDEFWVNVVQEYKEKEIKSITRSEIDLENNNLSEEAKKDEEDTKERFTKLTNHIKSLLGDSIKEVKLSKKLTESPTCLSVPEGAMDIRMERFLLEQKQLNSGSAKIFEINPKHDIINYLANKESFGPEDDMLIKILFDQACIVEGEPVNDASEFANFVTNVLKKAYL
ncbi:MAG: molecular chaperone HtpG [Sphingobacteriia bacterium]|nr:molecular chaperone HtpG [Sphingobacteriia bacterium]